ncbi:type IV secretion system protein [Nitriliruptor alkaliphilus]|uniref:type IV secretion system protein n=1 Tax=Nitriliruptor alkaliphilus TaxID=427918 RepID=UPI0006976008|nr:type IV secretion system protein [Nitriliruptor alkaliphilus]
MNIQRGIVATLVIAGLLMLAGLHPAAAQSQQVDGLIEGPPIQGDNEPTIAERYPVTSYRYPFHGEGVGIGSRSGEMVDQTLNALASLLILGAGLLAQGASRLVQWAFDPTTTDWLMDAVEVSVRALGDSVYGQVVLLVIMLGALWVAWQGIAQRRATTSLQGGIWMVAVVALGVAFFSQPRWFIETPHQVTTELTAGLFGAVAGVGASGSGSYYGEHPPTFSGPAAIDAQRQLEDQLWRVMVFEPWRISTFPSTEFADAYGEELLADRSEDNVQAIYDDIRDEDRAAAEYFAGREPLDRLVASGMTLLAALPIAVTMIVLGSALIVLQFAFVILSLLAPVFLLLGIHPGGGRNALLRWLDMWLGTLVKRVALTALISVLVSLFAFAAANLGQQGWYLTVLLTTLVCVAALVYRKTITELLASAAGSVGAGQEGEREHRSRAHPMRTTARTAHSANRAIKFMGAGALMLRAGQRTASDHAQKEEEGRRAAATTRGRRRRRGTEDAKHGEPATRSGNQQSPERGDADGPRAAHTPRRETGRRTTTGEQAEPSATEDGTDRQQPSAEFTTVAPATRQTRPSRRARRQMAAAHDQPTSTATTDDEHSAAPVTPATPRRPRSRGER